MDDIITRLLFIQADELEDMDFYAKQCAIKFEATKSISSRNRGRKGLDAAGCNLLNALLMKEGSPVPLDEDTASKKTSLALSIDITQPEVKSDVSETESVNVDEIVTSNSNTEPTVKKISETSSVPDINKSTPPQKAGFTKTSLSKVPLNVVDTEMQHYSIPTEEINHEPKSLSKIIVPAVTSGTEVFHLSGVVTSELTKQVIQQSDFEQTEHFPESVVPLDQRPSRRKYMGQTRAVEVQKIDSKKSQRTDDDLDFLLSLKGPVKEAQISSLRPSQVTKPTIEDGKLRPPFPRPLFYLCIT
jgi:hypothetical protein